MYELTVVVKHGKELLACDKSWSGVFANREHETSDPYVDLSVGNPNMPKHTVKASTTYVKKTLNPVWDATLNGVFVDEGQRTNDFLVLRLYDKDWPGRQVMGQVALSLSALHATETEYVMVRYHLPPFGARPYDLAIAANALSLSLSLRAHSPSWCALHISRSRCSPCNLSLSRQLQPILKHRRDLAGAIAIPAR